VKAIAVVLLVIASACGADRAPTPDARVIDPDAKPIFCATPQGQPCPDAHMPDAP
jgi:hypothetical protein